MTREIDPIIESALGARSRLGRALVFLDRAAWLLSEAEASLRADPDAAVARVGVTLEILRGATAQAAHDLAQCVCETDRRS